MSSVVLVAGSQARNVGYEKGLSGSLGNPVVWSHSYSSCQCYEMATSCNAVTLVLVRDARAPSVTSLVVIVFNAVTSSSIEGVVVQSSIQPSGQTQLSGLTNSSGIVSFNNISAGSYSLIIIKNQFFNETFSAYIYSGQQIIGTVSMYPIQFGNLVVRVLDADDSAGTGLSGAYVASSSGPSHQTSLFEVSGSLGYAFFNGILVGDYTIVVSLSGYYTSVVFAKISENATANQIVYLSRQSVVISSVPVVALSIIAASTIAAVLVLRTKRKRRRSGTAPETSHAMARETDTREVYTEENRSARMERPSTLPALGSCSYCGSRIKVRDAEFCWKCGANLTATNVALHRAGKSSRFIKGHCVVCGLEVRPSDVVVSCPNCGNVAHKTHMLEWLHVKDHCPACREHLRARDLVE